jgi:hypothetical protein
MSVRLNIVVVQSPKLTSLQAGITADIVIQLLGRPGLDVALIKSLSPESDTSTDQLMLTGLESDLAVIDWREPEKMLSDLHSLGMHGGRTKHELDPEGELAVPGRRRVYLFDLRQGHKANDVVSTLIKLLERRQVVTVSLLPPQSKPTASPQPKPQTTATSQRSMTPSLETPIDDVPSVSDYKPATAASHAVKSDAPVSLEDLVDRLNEIDL